MMNRREYLKWLAAAGGTSTLLRPPSPGATLPQIGRIAASRRRSTATISGFITEWTVAGDATARTITLPLYNSGTFDCTINWGDGSADSTVTAYNDADRAHTYATDGTYQVTITGSCPSWSFNDGGDKLKITNIIHWGSSGTGKVFNGFSYLSGGFYGCTGLKTLGPSDSIIPISGTGVSTSGFSATFRGCTGLTGAIPTDLFRYNTLVSENGFNATFYDCTKLSGAIPTDLFRYNTLVSTNGFNRTFYGCTNLVQVSDMFFPTGGGTSRFNRAILTLATLPATEWAAGDTVTDGTLSCIVGRKLPEEAIIRISAAVSPADWSVGAVLTNTGARSCKVLEKITSTAYRVKNADNISLPLTGWTGTITDGTNTATYSSFETCVAAGNTKAYEVYATAAALVVAGWSTADNGVYVGANAGKLATIAAIASNFTSCFNHSSQKYWLIVVTGGTLTWDVGTLLTSNGQTATVSGVKTPGSEYWVRNKSGTFSGNVVGTVVGSGTATYDASSALVQGTAPALWGCTFVSAPTTTTCWTGAGNSATSLSNYADIPVSPASPAWRT